jgi:cardiolipin synthase
MSAHHPVETTRGLPRAARWLGVCLLGAVAGCQAVAARPAGCHPSCPAGPRTVVLARQLVADTFVEGSGRPLREGLTLGSEPVAYLRAAGAGLVRKRLLLPLLPDPPPLDPTRPTLDPGALEHELKKRDGDDLRPTGVQLHIPGDEALGALCRVIAQARWRIDVLMYLWDADPLGEQVAAWVAARAAAGVRVRVLVDGGGNLLQGLPDEASTAEVNRVVCWLSRQPNVEVLRGRNGCLRFDHRKLVVVDGHRAWSGGRNFTRSAFVEAHDLSYTLAGPLAAEMAETFEASWRDQGGSGAGPLPAAPAPAPAPNAWARLVHTGPGERELARALYLAVDRACHHVYVENPYFGDSVLLVKLALARQRGADVRVVLTVSSGNEVLDRSNRVTANRLLRAGVRVYLYPGRTHVKATAVDGLWAYLGTGNFDSLSLRHNRELGLAVGAGPLLAALEEGLFLPDFRPGCELTEPLAVSPLDYGCEVLASLFL